MIDDIGKRKESCAGDLNACQIEGERAKERRSKSQSKERFEERAMIVPKWDSNILKICNQRLVGRKSV
jgi:hypothetical protein